MKRKLEARLGGVELIWCDCKLSTAEGTTDGRKQDIIHSILVTTLIHALELHRRKFLAGGGGYSAQVAYSFYKQQRSQFSASRSLSL